MIDKSELLQQEQRISEGHIWKGIPGYEETHQASYLGWIRSLDRIIIRGNNIKQPRKGKIIYKEHYGNQPYGIVSFGGKYHYVHRLVAMTFVSNPDSKPMINHKDGNKRNNCAENLEWVTRSENAKHAVRTGLTPPPPIHRGEDCHLSKLTNEQTLEICELFKMGKFSRQELADKFKVSKTLIGLILTGRIRSSVTGIVAKPKGVWKKIDEEMKKEIVKLYKSGKYSQVEIGEMFGITQGTVSGTIIRYNHQIGVTVAKVK